MENAKIKKIQMRHFEWFSNIVSNAIFIFYYPEEIPHPSIKRQKVFLCCQNFVIPQCRFDIYDRKNMARVAWESICWRKFVFTTSKCGLENTKQTGLDEGNLAWRRVHQPSEFSSTAMNLCSLNFRAKNQLQNGADANISDFWEF